MAAAKAYDWLKTVQAELVDKKEFTDSGAPKAFAWEALSRKLGARFDLQDLVIQGDDPEWGSQKKFQKVVGKSAWPLSFALGSLPGVVTFLMSKDDLVVLLAIALSQQPKGVLYPDDEFLEAFYRFLVVEVLGALSTIGFDSSIAPRLISEPAPVIEGKALGMGVSISAIGRVLHGQILAPEEFALAWNERYKTVKKQKEMSSEVAQKVEVTVHLEAGETKMTHQELRQIRQGDFLLLDYCSVAPDQAGGQVTLTTSGIPLFRGLLQLDNIKIMEYPLFQKVEPAMDIDDDVTDMDEDTVDVETDEAVPAEEQTPVEKMGEIPISLKIEVGQVRMTLAKLMELQPGATIELNVDPEEGVDLVVNGKCVGKGELLRLGETLGVRILEIG